MAIFRCEKFRYEKFTMKHLQPKTILACVSTLVLGVVIGVGVFLGQENSKVKQQVASPTDSSLNKASDPSCAQGGACIIGDQGPGGGTIFYDAGSVQIWGRYLEVAPVNAQRQASWGCTGTYIGGTGTEIGAGKSNSNIVTKACSDTKSAARIAMDFDGGAQTDWFLPSQSELAKLYSQLLSSDELETEPYWSSSEADAVLAQSEPFYGGLGDYKDNVYFVRPVRAF